ncbi:MULTISPECIES: nucleoside diphosphate kinase regulator [Marinobacter]|uniref:Nucleoside diphosphate kinase regulator n=1 Tax=Marinobacter xestospongiae TaxID=994319 RepID=A0ABU3VUS6_9GAMM|nr:MULTISPECIES: nucleoside diphosphate kinase regulator [Marinobacter]MCG8517765.1 nucleoside diphosphate kinase regulator [Pseudomonadales bacterium]MDV2078009.1 nucleoside diphosphate kinase regulator [Marinobacter xestospongiae]UDL06308.1 nucleoside diphosphate kinase regulator [Marinobacter sp. CA1]
MSELPAITVTEEDYNRLMSLLDRDDSDSDVLEGLAEELERAELVPADQLPEGVVAMNSLVRFVNEGNGQSHDLTLVYPHQAGAGAGQVSVFAPAGAALLGLSVGDRIDWPMSGGKILHLKIVSVTRPE